MTVLYFGIYNPAYPRNRVFIKGLRENGVEVIECNARGRGPYKYLKLIAKYFWSGRRHDVIMVGFPGQTVARLARFLSRKPLVVDSFLSLYDSEVFDRQTVPINSPKARQLFVQDKKVCELADLVLLDTQAHVDYFVRTFGIAPEKIRRIFVGTDPDIFKPQPKRSKEFTVHLHGKYIPLQGIEYVLGAAKLMQEMPITLRIVGRGQEYQKISSWIQRENLKNIALVDMVPYEQLPEYINDADICLGIFGSSEKTLRVIPNKVVEYMACGKPVITADSPAIRELLTDGVHAQFCRAADPQDLAEKITKLYHDPQLRQRLGQNARKLYVEKLTSQVLGKQLAEMLKDLLDEAIFMRYN